MNPEERIVTWLISLGVLDSPKKTICDPEEFLKSSLKNGVVLCKLINRLVPGSVGKVRSSHRIFGIADHQRAATK
jgi:Rho guanine nucleotide exchange factor 6